jgi:hypothetical protein
VLCNSFSSTWYIVFAGAGTGSEAAPGDPGSVHNPTSLGYVVVPALVWGATWEDREALMQRFPAALVWGQPGAKGGGCHSCQRAEQ